MVAVTGKFIEAGAGPLSNWRVGVWRLDHHMGWVLDGDATTDASGSFSITLPPLEAILFGPNPAAEVRLLDVVGRTAARQSFTLPLISDYSTGTVSVHPKNLRGWLATNLDPAGAPPRVSDDNLVEPQIDNGAAWTALRTAVVGAAHEIALQLFYFDLGFVYLTFTPDPPPVATPTVGTRLEQDLLDANRTRGVTIRLLIRDHSPLPYPIHTADSVAYFFSSASPPATIEVRRYVTDPRLPMHAKFVVVDGTEAHLTASPLLQEYFDGNAHLIDDPRRGPLSSMGPVFDPSIMLAGVTWPIPTAAALAASLAVSMKNSIRTPVHDVGARIQGGSVKDIHDTFFLHWNAVGSTASFSSILTPTPPTGATSTVQIVRSLPGATFPGLLDGEASILESYLRCFAQATDFIYLENQYLTEMRIYDAIRLSLSTNPNLQIILLTNHKLDIPRYQVWQPKRIIQLLQNLTTDGTADRFGAFTLWSVDNTATPPKILPNYVHTKVGIADDHWLTIGSANLDGVSLMTSEHLAPIAFQPGDENRRATEVNATVLDGLDGAGASTVPSDLRRALWAEHLGLGSPTDPLLTTRPTAGWLSLWQSQANAKVANLILGSPHGCRVLPWQAPAKPEAYLKALGVDVRDYQVMNEFRGFDFSTGKWQ
jgi:phosphatidylserine/phosphatidylglycerophosphate/cardiolipin synthase-like enzyme